MSMEKGIAQTGSKILEQASVEDQGWKDFRDQCRRQMQRPIEDRIKYGFCRMYKPVLDDAPWRAFETMAEYKNWCATQLPDYLGYKPAKR
jgi:hypothetical protein